MKYWSPRMRVNRCGEENPHITLVFILLGCLLAFTMSRNVYTGHHLCCLLISRMFTFVRMNEWSLDRLTSHTCLNRYQDYSWLRKITSYSNAEHIRSALLWRNTVINLLLLISSYFCSFSFPGVFYTMSLTYLVSDSLDHVACTFCPADMVARKTFVWYLKGKRSEPKRPFAFKLCFVTK